MNEIIKNNVVTYWEVIEEKGIKYLSYKMHPIFTLLDAEANPGLYSIESVTLMDMKWELNDEEPEALITAITNSSSVVNVNNGGNKYTISHNGDEIGEAEFANKMYKLQVSSWYNEYKIPFISDGFLYERGVRKDAVLRQLL